MASENAKKLGRLSLSILENFVAGHLGDDFLKKLKDPYEKKKKLEEILASAEDRFMSEHKDQELSKAIFADLSQKDRPDLQKAIKSFYDNPARDISMREELSKVLFGEFSFLTRKRVDRASNDYLRILTEEIANEDEDFRSRLLSLVTSRNNALAGNQRGIWESVYDFSDLINEKSRDFVGRDYLFRKIEDFISIKSRGYVFIVGEPGIGKTAFLASLINRNDYIYHFNSLNEGINTPQKFYENICAQLILKYSLNYTSIPNGSAEVSRFFTNLLNEINSLESMSVKIVIAIDALDEVRHPELSEGANVLFLPSTLPKNVYVISTTRESPKWKIDCDREIIEIEKMSAENQKDIENYLWIRSEMPSLVSHLQTYNLSKLEFVSIMQDKSEGNFMYLRHVIPEIAVGAYNNLNLMELPKGLQNYYEDHWRRMKVKDQATWFEYKLPIIMILSVSAVPMSIGFISRILNMPASRVAYVISEWEQFLNRGEIIHADHKEVRYRLYHLSFIDFLHHKEEVQAEQVDFNRARQNILNYYDRPLESSLND